MAIAQPKVSAVLRGDFTKLSERKLVGVPVHPQSALQATASDVRRTRRTLNALAINTPCTSASPRNTPLY